MRKKQVAGEGTGDLKEHLNQFKISATTIFVSGMSAEARGYDEALLADYNAAFAMPNVLLE